MNKQKSNKIKKKLIYSQAHVNGTDHHISGSCCNLNRTLGNKLHWNFNRNSSIFVEEKTFDNVVCDMFFISSRPQCDKHDIMCCNRVDIGLMPLATGQYQSRSSTSWHSYIVVRYNNPHVFRFTDVMLWAGVYRICLISAYWQGDYLCVIMRVCSSSRPHLRQLRGLAYSDSVVLTCFGFLYKAKIKDEG